MFRWYRKRRGSRLKSRFRWMIEVLEERNLFAVEGALFTLDRTVDTAGLLGTISATANWRDGTSTPLTVSNQTSVGALVVRIDYSLDSRGFFNSPERRQLLQFAADTITSRFADSLEAIQPSGTNTWTARITHPATGGQQPFTNPTIAANEIVIYAGSRDLPGNQLGEGGAGSFGASGTQAWLNQVRGRGQAGALGSSPTDFAPWGGSISFDDLVNWHFGLDTTGLDSNEFDFYTVATHELTHALGFGVSQSWNRFIQGSNYVGPNSMSAYDVGGAVPMADSAHWREGLTDNGQETLMDPSIAGGVRKLMTGLDLAGLADLGWQVIVPSARITGSHVFGDDGNYPISITITGSQVGSKTLTVEENVTNVAPSLADRSSVTISAGLPLIISDLGSFTDPGFDLPAATPPKTERFRYRIDWGDGTPAETGDATIDQMGSATSVTRGSFDGTHTYSTPGTYTVSYTITDDDGGTASKSFSVQVTPPPSISLQLDKTTIAENGGSVAAILTVRRSGFDTNQPTVVTLQSGDLTEVKLPSSVTILAGGTEAIVAVEAVDDTLLDGTIVVQIGANVGSVQATPISIQVTDFETITLVLSQGKITENAGPTASRLTVTRSNTDQANSLDVLLGNNDTSEATIPSLATIPASSASVIVDVGAVDDSLIDGLQQVRFSAQAVGYVGGEIVLEVEDFEPIVMTVDSISLTEELANRRTRGSIRLPGPAPSGGISVSVQASQENQLIFPASINVAAGESIAVFDIEARDDFIVEGPHGVKLTATAAGMIPAAVDIALTDNDQPLWKNPVEPLDVNNDGAITANDALIIINLLNLRGGGELDPGGGLTIPPFYDPNGNGILEALDVLLIINYLNLIA